MSRRLTEALFDVSGRSSRQTVFPLTAIYMLVEANATGTRQPVPAQMMISVPKKRFRHAVDRNRVKRQVREAYRHEKGLLWSAVPEGMTLVVAFVWLSASHEDTCRIHSRVVTLIRKISHDINRQ